MKGWGIYIAVALGFFVYGAVSEVDRDGSGAIIGEGNVNAFQVRVGDCFDDSQSNGDEVSNVPGVPCSEPHDNETYAVIDLTMASYPEGDGMEVLAFDSCIERFNGFVGQEYDSSSLDILTMYPSSESWTQNDREVVCAVYHMDAEKLVGSAKGKAL